MNAEGTKRAEERLNATMRVWSETDDVENAARKQALYNDAMITAYSIFDDGKELFVKVLDECMRGYRADRGPFCHYFSYVYSRRLRGEYVDVMNWRVEYNNTDGDADEEASPLENIPSGDGDLPERIAEREAPFVELTSMVINFAHCHHGRAANSVREEWFRLFYTEDITWALQTAELRLLHERDVFDAMELPYLDYYMTQECRTKTQVRMTPLKAYGDVVPERADIRAETQLPLPADVSLAYLKICKGREVGATARSEQHRVYKEELHQIVMG